MANQLRIAVRKFGPFEDAIRRQFDDFAQRESVDARMEFDALELNELHAALFEKDGLKNGTYDITFMVTDWLAAAVDENLMPSLLEAVKAEATLGEICAALKEVFGTYKEPVVL